MTLSPLTTEELEHLAATLSGREVSWGILRAATEAGIAVVARNGSGEPLGYGGALMIREGRATTWLLLTDYGRTHPVAACKAVKQFMARVWATGAVTTVEANVDPQDAVAVRFVERLGFTFERPMHTYTLRSGGA